MSNSFTVGKYVLLTLDYKLVGQKTDTFFSGTFFSSISIVAIYFVKPVEAQILTSLPYSLPGTKTSKTIVTFLNF